MLQVAGRCQTNSEIALKNEGMRTDAFKLFRSPLLEEAVSNLEVKQEMHDVVFNKNTERVGNDGWRQPRNKEEVLRVQRMNLQVHHSSLVESGKVSG